MTLHESKRSTALDLGCGQGYFLLTLAEHFEHVIGTDLDSVIGDNDISKVFTSATRWPSSYVGRPVLDVTREMIKIEAGDAKIELRAAKIGGAIPANDETIDTLFALDVLEHAKDPAFLMTEIQRVLKPGGEFIYSVPNSVGPAFFLRTQAGRWAGVEEDPDTHDHRNYNWKDGLAAVSNVFQVDKITSYPTGVRTIDLSILIRCRKK